ncbi:MAG: hypothetical protein ACREBU_17640 [Nitrososphaera sp.]
MPGRVSPKGKWKSSIPISDVGNRRPNHSRSQELASSKLAVASTVVATIAALVSAWVAYKQFELQAVQTTMQAEQAALAKQQVRIQALQALPILTVKRKTVNAKLGRSTLEVCGAESTMRLVSGFKALWLSEFGRYPLPSTDPSKIQRVRVALLNEDGVTWQSTSVASGDHCASASEPNWLPILNFVSTNRGAPAGFAYWHRSEAMVVVFQKDGTGTEYPRHYIFVHERPDEAQLVSDAEAAQWISDYKSAYRGPFRATISGPAASLNYIHGFFK